MLTISPKIPTFPISHMKNNLPFHSYLTEIMTFQKSKEHGLFTSINALFMVILSP